MANLNLSQFTEKTLVADADWVFVWDTAGSISKKVSRNSLLNSGTLATSAPVTISQTWADVAQTFKALVVNADGTSDANSASGSLLLDLQVGGVSKAYINKAGQLILPPGTSSAPSFCFQTGANGFYKLNNGFGYATDTNNPVLTANYNSALGMLSGMFLGWSTNVFTQPDWDVRLYKDGAGQLALRNGAAAQTFNVYGTWTTAVTNFERLAIKYNASDFAYQIAAEKGSTNGDYRPLDFVTGGSRRMTIATTGNVGIGTTAPSVPLEVVSATAVQIIARSGTGLTSGAYFAAIGQQESYFNVTTNSNASGNRNMRFGNSSANTFVVQALSDDALSILRTPVSIANAAPTGSLHILSSGNVGIGTTAPTSNLEVASTSSTQVLVKSATGAADGVYVVAQGQAESYYYLISKGNLTGSQVMRFGNANSSNFVIQALNDANTSLSRTPVSISNAAPTGSLQILSSGNVGIGTTAPSSKLHVAGNSSPSITIDNTLATGYSQLLLKNTVVTGDTDGIFLNGSTQTGFGGAGSLNIKATTGPIAFHTATVTNALSIAQSGNCTVAGTMIIGNNLGLQASDSVLNWSGRSNISAPSAAIIRLIDNAQTNFNILQFGGASGFPGLKRVGSELQVVVASTAAAMNVAAVDADLTFIEDRFRRKGAGSPEGAVTAPIGAVYHRTDGGLLTSFYVKESGTGNTGWVGK